MQVAYKFKLRPKQGQIDLLEDWQHKVGYIQNRSLGDRVATYNNIFVMGDYCDLYTKREVSAYELYCDINLYLLHGIPNIVSPLHCSVSKSASLGNIWKEDKPSLRRSKDKEKPFNPKRSAYEMHSNWVTEFKQANPEFKNVNADVIQQALRHVDGAFNKFFSGKAGFPNFKQHIDISFEFKPGTVRIINKYIIFPTLGGMRFFKSREIPPSWEIRTVTISREVDGWYVSVLLRDETVPDLPTKKLEECESIQGVDVGIKKLASLSDGTLISNPQFLKKSERRLRIRQRRVSRKQKGSRKRKKAVIQLSRLHQKIRRQREDYQWKQAKIIASKANIIVFEDLNIKGMKSRCKPKIDETTGKYIKNGQSAKAALNQAISDASWYSLRHKTEHQAQKLGNLVILVDPKNTSITCPECGHTSSSNRDKEKFLCENCSHYADADVNGAINIASKARTNLGLDTLQVDSLKVTPKNTEESSFPLGDEPGNPAKSTAKQLRVVSVKSVEVEKKPPKKRCKSKPKKPDIGIQLDLFGSFDGDEEELVS